MAVCPSRRLPTRTIVSRYCFKICFSLCFKFCFWAVSDFVSGPWPGFVSGPQAGPTRSPRGPKQAPKEAPRDQSCELRRKWPEHLSSGHLGTQICEDASRGSGLNT